MFEAKALDYKELPGLSERQLSEHHDVLYVGYVKKINEIRENLKIVNLESANQTYSQIRELKIEEGFALDGIKLHELYFENLGGDGNPTEKITEVLNSDFGSFDKWKEELIACGMSARGWVVLSLDEDRKLHHYICDAHNQGGIWNAKPILVLDTYEHAYFIDYGTNRKAYIEAFINNINWKVVENRL